jgi:hypothetical protein
MRIKRGILKSIIICLGVAGVVAQGHAANMCIDSKKIALIQFDACLKRAAASMAKHYNRSETVDDTVFGFRGEYVAGILCNATDRGVVFFASSGPDANVCHQSMESLIKDF